MSTVAASIPMATDQVRVEKEKASMAKSKRVLTFSDMEETKQDLQVLPTPNLTKPHETLMLET
jgi:hypothetical protein